MNAILLNAAIAFGMLSVLIIPLYIASKSSKKNQISVLTKICSDLARRENMIILREKYIGNKVFAFTETDQVLIVIQQGQQEQSYILDNKLVDSILITEKFERNQIAEIKLIYHVSERKKEILLYKEHRESASDVLELRKISNEIKQFLTH